MHSIFGREITQCAGKYIYIYTGILFWSTLHICIILSNALTQAHTNALAQIQHMHTRARVHMRTHKHTHTHTHTHSPTARVPNLSMTALTS
jgi:hypothetical protein